MPKEEPIDEVIHQIKALIGLLQTNLFKMVSSEETVQTEKQVQDLEKQIDKFIEESEKTFAEWGLTREQMRKIEDGIIPKGISGEAAETILQAEKLKKKLFELREIVAREQGPFDEERPEKRSKPISKSQHMKKFKRLGGSSDWKPL